MPLISIIVPIYNVEKYLRDCVESILAQTFTDIEILLIDDGSPDACGAICDEYAQRDSRVRVFHKENGGLSSARNLGLDKASGKWIMFVDSDDKIAPQICERLLEYATEDCLPISPCYALEDNQIRRYYDPIEGNAKFEVKDFYTLGFRVHSAGAKLYHHATIKKYALRFSEEVYYAEDAIFNYEYLEFIKYIYLVDEELYYYRLLPISMSHGSYIKKYEFSVHMLYERIMARAKQYTVDNDAFYKRYYTNYFVALCLAFQNNMHKDAPGTWVEKMQCNNAVLKSEAFKNAYPYRYENQKKYTKCYIHMLELSYYTGNYFWLWLLSVPRWIRKTISGKNNP